MDCESYYIEFLRFSHLYVGDFIRFFVFVYQMLKINEISKTSCKRKIVPEK